MTQEVTLFVASALLFFVWALLVRHEQKKKQRFFAAKFRGWLDGRMQLMLNKLSLTWDHFVKYILQLNWYYSIHSVLKTILRMTVAFYSYFENMFERNRSKAKQLRAEKREISQMGHLQQVADHKRDTALTPAEQKRLRKKKLEEKH